ncbi:hypothetical protein L5876_05620 [Hyphobacterium sp. SN044]|uniref:hypothetical protein n=1 Tax=Hyphobacterium sp. SN044 TaxID=2912575 RepID=UPI001F4475C9|nr:hypothetical protein [Hyphobacterium sp. SN044]MCF8879289.1 hypothetical protein [Hyphobacterium sp. SN044]
MKKSLLVIAGAAGLAMSLTAVADAQHRGGMRGHHGGGHGMHGLMMLRAADANGDNTITRAEVDQLQAEMFAWMDRNGDGVLSSADRSPMHQRLAALRDEQASGDEGRRGRWGRHGRGGPDGGHARMDANGDGQVTREEFMSRGAPGFERLDANSDGSVTPDELDAAMERGRERREDRVFWWRD